MDKSNNSYRYGNYRNFSMSNLTCITIVLILSVLVFLQGGCTPGLQIPASKTQDKKTGDVPGTIQKPNEEINNGKNTDEESSGYIIADEVRIRDGYDSGSQVTELLNIGKKVRIVGKSEDRFKIGSYEDYWYNIEFDGKNGWCYGEYISEDKDLKENLERRFENYLTAEDATVKGAATTLLKYMELNPGTDFIDSTLRKIRKFQDEIRDKYEKELRESTTDFNDLANAVANSGENKNEKIKTALNHIRDNGFSPYQAEGDIYLESDPDFYLKKFERGMSDNMRLYLNLELVEVRQHFAQDAGLIITWDELADRIENWDYYIRKYPGTPETKTAEMLYERYLRAYVKGMDNTSLFEYQTKKLDDRVRESYERFIKEYSNTRAIEVVKGFYDVLKKNNFELTKQVQEYMEKL